MSNGQNRKNNKNSEMRIIIITRNVEDIRTVARIIIININQRYNGAYHTQAVSLFPIHSSCSVHRWISDRAGEKGGNRRCDVGQKTHKQKQEQNIKINSNWETKSDFPIKIDYWISTNKHHCWKLRKVTFFSCRK